MFARNKILVFAIYNKKISWKLLFLTSIKQMIEKLRIHFFSDKAIFYNHLTTYIESHHSISIDDQINHFVMQNTYPQHTI